MFGGLMAVFRSTVFLTWMVLVLLTTSVGATVWAVQSAVQAAALSAQMASMAARHQKQLRKAVLRAKARARIRRLVVAIPVLGGGAVAYFEEQDFREWREQNEGGTRADYGCELYSINVEMFDDFMRDIEPVLEKMPERVRPSRETIIEWLGECDQAQ